MEGGGFMLKKREQQCKDLEKRSIPIGSGHEKTELVCDRRSWWSSEKKEYP